MKHTKEPWNWHGDTIWGGEGEHTEILSVGDNGKPFGLHSAVLLMDNSEPDKARIVACVNALAGIKDPAAFVAEAKRRGCVE